MENKARRTSAWWWMFRVVLSAIGVLTIVGSSHAVRYVLCGVLAAILVVQWLVGARGRRGARDHGARMRQ
jgi:hypothetical protein